MFESIRGKFYTVQQDITASFKNLTIGDGSKKNVQKGKNVCPNAGADLLNKYQNQWKLLHDLAEENAQKAIKVDAMIGKLQQHCDSQLNSIGQLNAQLTLLPKLNYSLQNLMEHIGKLENSFEEVEMALVHLEDIIEIQELQEKQLDHRFQLALYKERKLADLEQLKVHLANEHAEKVQAFELRQQAVLKERQEAFKEAFEEEMQHYKTHGHIERIPSAASDSSIPLEDVQLDTDDSAALDEFLAEEATEDVMRQYALAEAIADEVGTNKSDSDS